MATITPEDLARVQLHKGGEITVRVSCPNAAIVNGTLADVVWTGDGFPFVFVIDTHSGPTVVPWHSIRSYRCTPPTQETP
jgi:hypothetical protein